MTDLNTARTVGGIGSVLTILSFIPSAGPALTVIGLVLILLALKWISDIRQTPEIFKNALIAVVVAIIGIAAGVVVGGVGLFSFLAGAADPNILGLFTTIIVAIAVAWVFGLVSAIFWRRSLNMTADQLGVNMFRTAGLLILIGAALTIILIGALVTLVAYVLLAVAFFQIRTAPPPPPPPSP